MSWNHDLQYGLSFATSDACAHEVPLESIRQEWWLHKWIEYLDAVLHILTTLT